MKMKGINMSLQKARESVCKFCYNLDGIETGTALEDRAALMKDAKMPGTSCGICRINNSRRQKKAIHVCE
jgi:hypothetical protein